MTRKISVETARCLALQAQWLNGPDLKGPAGTLSVLQQLGYVQIDSISVVERAHHHVLWTRQPDYHPDFLNQLLGQRQVFEYWGHAASYLPLSDYRYYLPTMQNFVQNSRWARERLALYKDLIPEVLERLRQEGPLKASDFKGERRKGGWWNWKPAKIVLELLYWQGEIMVAQRDKFQKVYDLRERFLPPDLDVSMPSREEVAQFCLQRAFQAHALISWAELKRHLPLVNAMLLKQILEQSIEAGSVLEIQVGTLSEPYFILSEDLKKPKSTEIFGLHILSPFDNLVIQRQRLRNLFAFDYIFEAYVPQAKRKFGYFSLPVLCGQSFIARLACKAERKTGVLKILKITPESVLDTSERSELEQKLKQFAVFNGCSKIDCSE